MSDTKVHHETLHPIEDDLSAEEGEPPIGLPDYSKLLSDYQKNMGKIITEYNFKSPENPGNIAKKVNFGGKEYALIEITHSAVCDNPTCQNMFMYQDNLETGMSAFYYPILPIYTHNMEKEYCALCIGL